MSLSINSNNSVLSTCLSNMNILLLLSPLLQNPVRRAFTSLLSFRIDDSWISWMMDTLLRTIAELEGQIDLSVDTLPLSLVVKITNLLVHQKHNTWIFVLEKMKQCARNYNHHHFNFFIHNVTKSLLPLIHLFFWLSLKDKSVSLRKDIMFSFESNFVIVSLRSFNSISYIALNSFSIRVISPNYLVSADCNWAQWTTSLTL